MNKARVIALAVCAATAGLLLSLLMLCSLSAATPVQQRHTTGLLPVEEEIEEYVDFAASEPHDDSPEAAYAKETQSTSSNAAERSAPVEPTPQQLQAQARKEVSRDIAQAFKSADDAKDNTENRSKDKTKGDTGNPDNNLSAANGSGEGSVGGGWIMPKYAKVRSTQTGRIELRATIDANGKVVKVEQTGGKAPAGTDAALVKRCMAEVRSRRFTRTDDNPPPSATARIVYTFK